MGHVTYRYLSDEMWARIEPSLPPVKGAMGRPMRSHRTLIEGVDLPSSNRVRVA